MPNNRFTLRFDKNLERDFLTDYFKQSLVQIRVSHFILLILYMSFNIIDYYAVPTYYSYFSIIRYIIVLPVFLSIIVLSYTKYFQKYWQIALLVSYIVAGGGIILMLRKVPYNHYYLLGMMLVFTAGFALIRLRFICATIAGWSLLILYNLCIHFSIKMAFVDATMINFFFASSILIGMITNYYQEAIIRRNYFLRRDMQDREDVVLSVNDALSMRMDQKKVELQIRNEELLKEIEHRNEIEKELIIAKENAESANKLKSTFIANMSHEIRTPINAILGLSEILSNESENEEHKKFILSISKAGNVLLDLINDILDFSHLESNEIKVSHSPVNLKELMDEMNTIFWQKINSKGLTFNITYPEDIKPMLLDKSQIRQVLINLIGNAIKFTDSGSISMNLQYKLVCKSACNITFSISDTGIGIPDEDLESIFTPFVQSSNNKYVSEMGTGLGLAISKRIVENRGGTISVVSKIDEGTTFTIELPDVQFAQSEKKSGQMPVADLDEWDFEGKRALIVDDILINRKVLRKQLERMNLHVTDADSAFSAMEVLEGNEFDVFCFDLRMPKMNGAELAEKVKENSRFSNIPIICITASINPEENYCLEYFSAILFKPCKHNQIAKTIEKVFEK